MVISIVMLVYQRVLSIVMLVYHCLVDFHSGCPYSNSLSVVYKGAWGFTAIFFESSWANITSRTGRDSHAGMQVRGADLVHPPRRHVMNAFTSYFQVTLHASGYESYDPS